MGHRACPSCGAHRGGRLITDLHLRVPDDHPLGSGYPVVSCSVCGCGFADVVVPVDYYESYYGSLAKYGNASSADHGKASAQPEPIRDPGWLNDKADDSALRIEAHLSSIGA